jgi:hypothetical protein
VAQMCQQTLLAGDGTEHSGFRGRIYVAMVAAAVAVAAETQTAGPVVYAKRQALAAGVLGNPLAYLERFAIGAASNSTIGGDVSAPVVVTSSSTANPTVVTTAAVHGMATGDTVQIAGHSTAAPNGQWVVTVLTTTTYTVPVPGGAGGVGGTSTRQPSDANITAFGPFSQWPRFAGITANDV